LPVKQQHPLATAMMRTVMGITGFIVLAGLIYYGLGWTKNIFGSWAGPICALLVLAAYVGLVAYRAGHPDMPLDDLEKGFLEVPNFAETARTGLHFLLPVGVLIWCLMVEEMSPGLSAFWGTATLMLLLVTQRPLTSFFRHQNTLGADFRTGVKELIDGLEAAARNMTAVGIATATAGIIVGTVLLTGVGLVMTEIVEFISNGNLIAMLLLTAIICIVLGMGMPTTASYVVVATLMAPVIVNLAGQNDLAVPLVAVHLFVFYFGLMADVTPPVGLAAYAAAAISGADPVKTGYQGFMYEIRTGLLPFIFIFNNSLLMIDVEGPLHLIIVLAGSVLAMAAFVAATQHWFLIRNRWYETVLLLVACFTLFRPGFWLDQIAEPYAAQPASAVMAEANKTPPGQALRLRIEAQNSRGDTVQKLIRLDLGEGATGNDRMRSAGLNLNAVGDSLTVSNVRLGSQVAKNGILPGDEIVAVMVPTERPSRFWFMLPALAVIGIIAWLQVMRRRSQTAAVAA
ncbi:MAG: DUF3394 domain-containing protein, partial [Ferrovibrio sp.]